MFSKTLKTVISAVFFFASAVAITRAETECHVIIQSDGQVSAVVIDGEKSKIIPMEGIGDPRDNGQECLIIGNQISWGSSSAPDFTPTKRKPSKYHLRDEKPSLTPEEIPVPTPRPER